MKEIRPRLTDDDMSLIVSALRARLAMCGPTRKKTAQRLIERLEDIGRGNPTWRFGWESEADRVERLSTYVHHVPVLTDRIDRA